MNIKRAFLKSDEQCKQLESWLVDRSPDYLRLALRRAYNDFGEVEIQFYQDGALWLDNTNQIVVIGQNDSSKFNAFTVLGVYCQYWHTPCCTPEFFEDWMNKYGENTTLEGLSSDFLRKTNLRLAVHDGSTFAVENRQEYWASLTAKTRTKINKLRTTFDHLTIEWSNVVPDLSHLMTDYLTVRDVPVFPSFQNVIKSHVELMSVADDKNLVMIVKDEQGAVVACNLSRIIDGTLVDCTCVRSIEEKYSGIGVWCIARNIDHACDRPDVNVYSLGGAEVAYKSQFVPDTYRYMLTLPLGVFCADSRQDLVGQYQKGGLTVINPDDYSPSLKGYRTVTLGDLVELPFMDVSVKNFVSKVAWASIHTDVAPWVRDNCRVFLDSLVLLNPENKPVAMQGALNKVNGPDYTVWNPFLYEQRILNDAVSDKDLAALLETARRGGGVNLFGIDAGTMPDWSAKTHVQVHHCGDYSLVKPEILAALPTLEVKKMYDYNMYGVFIRICNDHALNSQVHHYRSINWLYYWSEMMDGSCEIWRCTQEDGLEVGYLVMTKELGKWCVADYLQTGTMVNHMGTACLKAVLDKRGAVYRAVVLTKSSRSRKDYEKRDEAWARRFANSPSMLVYSLYATTEDEAIGPLFDLTTMEVRQ